MSIVRFAMICDRCGERSAEYTPWSTCRDCGQDFCGQCSVDPSGDERNLVTCLKCKAEREAAAKDIASGLTAFVTKDLGPGAIESVTAEDSIEEARRTR